jgi:excisionase family DNA binding protein
MEPDTNRGGEQSGSDKLYTLSEVSQKTGISMPTLQRYKKAYQSRIPSVGKGRKQRYPESALPVFGELKNENAGRRGRPRKDASAAGRRGPAAGRKAAAVATTSAATARRRGAAKRSGATAASAAPAAKRGGARRGRPPGSGKRAVAAAAVAGAARAKKSGNLMTLTQISEQTGISYPTLVRYVRLHSNRLPSEGTGRSRRFYPEAVSVFRQLRQESGRGGRKKGTVAVVAVAAKRRGRPAKGTGRGRAAASSDEGLGALVAQRLKALERSQESIEKRLRGFVQSLQKLFS